MINFACKNQKIFSPVLFQSSPSLVIKWAKLDSFGKIKNKAIYKFKQEMTTNL